MSYFKSEQFDEDLEQVLEMALYAAGVVWPPEEDDTTNLAVGRIRGHLDKRSKAPPSKKATMHIVYQVVDPTDHRLAALFLSDEVIDQVLKIQKEAGFRAAVGYLEGFFDRTEMSASYLVHEIERCFE